MLIPTDLKNLTPAINNPALGRIEDHIDAAIRIHAAHGLSGPVVVQTTRSGWTQRDIATVLDLYRSAGWTVSGGDAYGVMCRLTA